MSAWRAPVPAPLEQLDVRPKLLVGLGLLVGVALTPSGHWGAFGFYAALVFSLWWWGAPRLPLWRAIFWVSPLVLAALPWLWLTPGPSWLTLRWGDWHLVLTKSGGVRFASLFLRTVLSAAAATLLLRTTPWTALWMALRAWGMPRLLVTITGLTLRYLENLTLMVTTLQRARAARSLELPGRRSGGTLAWRARITGGMAGNLFLRALEQSERTHQAMLARGFDGEVRALPLPPLSRRARATGFALAVLISLAGMIIP